MAQKIQRMPMWLGKYPMLDTTPEHEADLEMRAAIYEHHHRLPRHEAEARAHADYRRDKIIEAAAHHYNGMNAAAAAGNKESAKQHAYHYALAMHQLGHKDLVTPPDEVADRAKNTPSEDIARFKGHKADIYSLPEEPDDDIQRTGNEKQVKERAAMKKAEEQEIVRWFVRKHAAEHGLIKAEEMPEKCISCGGPYHPASGHRHQEDAPVCGPCIRNFIQWMKGHTKRKWGGEDFYEAAATSIKPGMSKSEITDEYPKDHQLGMEVPAGGSNCAKCKYVSEDLKKCGNEVFQEWNGGKELPKPAFKYCCDLYEIKK